MQIRTCGSRVGGCMKRKRWIVGGVFVIALIFITVVLVGRITSRETPQGDDEKKMNIESTKDDTSEDDSRETDAESFEDVFNNSSPNNEATKEDADGEKNPPKQEETDGEKNPSKDEETNTESESEDTDESQLSEDEDTETKYGEIY